MRIGIIGAGMAGLGAASHLQAKGHEVRLFDKGRGAGGRMATRRLATPLGEALFDHGAQYFTVRDPQFAACVETWQQAGLVARWPVAGDTAFVGTPSMNAPLRAMADRLAVTWSAKVDAVTPVAAGWTICGDAVDPAPYDAIVMAIPAEQAAVLLRPIDCRLADLAASAVSEPCWTVMAAFADPLPGSGDILPKAPGPIGWAARNRAKPGRTGPEAWVVQANPAWSLTHLEDDAAAVTDTLLAALAQTIGTALPPLLLTSAHRWRYARPASLGLDCHWDSDRRLGVCGDWLTAPRVESAWLSGYRLAQAMTA